MTTTLSKTPKTRTRSRATERPEYQIKGVEALLGPDPIFASNEDGIEARMVKLEDIDLPGNAPRAYFDQDAIWQLVDSIKVNGVLDPIIVRPMASGKYELVCGVRRYRAAGIAALSHIPCIVRNMNDEAALEMAIVENLQREDLNPLEETEGILRLLAMKLSLTVEGVIEIFNKAAHPQREIGHNVIHSESWQVIDGVFHSIGRFSPESFRANRIPLLKLPHEVKEAIEKGKLHYSKAKLVAKVKDNDERRFLLDRVISNDLSVRDIKEIVSDLDNKFSHRPPQIVEITKGLRTLSRRLNGVKGPMPKRKVEQLEKLVTLIEKLLNE